MAFAEKLTEAIRARNSVLCAGIDPHLDRILPKYFNKKTPRTAYAIGYLNYCPY